MDIQECIDCNVYEDISREDSFLTPLGDNNYICPICAEARETN